MNIAIGILIGRGHAAQGAARELQRRADHSRVNLVGAAEALLRDTQQRAPEDGVR